MFFQNFITGTTPIFKIKQQNIFCYNNFSQNNTKSDTSFIAFGLHEQRRNQKTALIKLRLIKEAQRDNIITTN